ncbi:MAG: DUF2314 domain-containing protein [Deltaproteobacteria bacterium]|nr:DUF2314 domain-containing protein [Deltaproteobacteria bacterium]MBN2673565.1 DUF2314 domain-containing protein [Deltaproteobacteria bacterium]
MNWSGIAAIVLFIAIAAVLLFFFRGGSHSASTAEKNDDTSTMVEVEQDDAEMAQAIQTARKTVDVFLSRFQHPRKGDTHFSVKMKLTYQTESEHVWLTDIVYENGVFVGKIANDPEVVTHVRFGETVQVAREDISDWMWLANGKMHGGYTFRGLLKNMPKKK